MEGLYCIDKLKLTAMAPLRITTLTRTPSRASKCCDLGFHASLARYLPLDLPPQPSTTWRPLSPRGAGRHQNVDNPSIPGAMQAHGQ